jgi:small subunit ribosomal protein S2
MSNIDKMADTEAYKALSKRERLQISREREKLEKNLGSIADMSRIPAALFVVDINKEKIAVAEARKLNIPIFGMVDTNSDPTQVDFAIPANDDASKSISIIVNAAVMAVAEGLGERKAARDKQQAESEKKNVEEIDIKAKSENLAKAEEEADIEAEKAAKTGTPVKKVKDATGQDGKAKRPRKRIVKK